MENAARTVARLARRGGTCLIELVKRHADGMTRAEVADQLQVSRQSVDATLASALRKAGPALAELGWTLPP